MLNTRNEAGKGAFTPSKFKPTLRLARFVRATLAPLMHLNLKTLTVTRVGRFAGCPSVDGAPIIAD